jgi:hydrogenase maturation protease
MKELSDRLHQRLENAEKVVIVGTGEVKMTDDGVGVYIATELLKESNEKVLVINAGIDPMARMEEIIDFNPSHLIIIDTCTLDKEPGTVSIIEREKMADLVPISTHTVPIHVIIDLIAEEIPDLDVFMLGIVPKSLEGIYDLNQYKKDKLSVKEINENDDLPFFSIELTETIKETANNLIEILKKLIEEL